MLWIGSISIFHFDKVEKLPDYSTLSILRTPVERSLSVLLHEDSMLFLIKRHFLRSLERKRSI